MRNGRPVENVGSRTVECEAVRRFQILVIVQSIGDSNQSAQQGQVRGALIPVVINIDRGSSFPKSKVLYHSEYESLLSTIETID